MVNVREKLKDMDNISQKFNIYLTWKGTCNQRNMKGKVYFIE